MQINCLACGFKIDLDETYHRYIGLIRCSTCKNLMQIQFEDGFLKSSLLIPLKVVEEHEKS